MGESPGTERDLHLSMEIIYLYKTHLRFYNKTWY